VGILEIVFGATLYIGQEGLDHLPDSAKFSVADHLVPLSQGEGASWFPDVHALAGDCKDDLFTRVAEDVSDLFSRQMRVALNRDAEHPVVETASEQLVQFDLTECLVGHHVLDDSACHIDFRGVLDALQSG